IDAIISAAETGFTGSLVGSSIPCTEGLFPGEGLTMFRVSMPRQQSRTLLQCEPPHWYRRPSASWTSWSCVHTPPRTHLREPMRREEESLTYSSTQIRRLCFMII
uniref:Uncharacterized protein n=1 Tax=Scophthalmus maximus TaxID=52904 RepID=A0A8D3BHS7_SCOMX